MKGLKACMAEDYMCQIFSSQKSNNLLEDTANKSLSLSICHCKNVCLPLYFSYDTSTRAISELWVEIKYQAQEVSLLKHDSSFLLYFLKHNSGLPHLPVLPLRVPLPISCILCFFYTYFFHMSSGWWLDVHHSLPFKKFLQSSIMQKARLT